MRPFITTELTDSIMSVFVSFDREIPLSQLEDLGWRMDPDGWLILEITESVSVRNAAQIRQNVIALKKYGVRVALDDFGEGFTSFYDLQKYPIDGIKLDKGLVDHVTTPIGTAILKAMIQVGHELNMTILAEGVETDEQVRALQEIHCDVIQGFRFSHPLPRWEATEQIIQNRRT